MVNWGDSKAAGAWIKRNRSSRGWSQAALAEQLGRFYRQRTGLGQDFSQQTIANWEGGKLKGVSKFAPMLEELFSQAEIHRTPDLPVSPDLISYVQVDILPTFGGMGGGGTGDDDVERALVPRYLIENVYRGRPSDFVVVRTRGDSMEPDFYQDDELLCDKRDTSPVQPGPFAIWDAEDEAYVIKNVEKLGDGRIRVFATNQKYTPTELNREETTIIGRPVWFARRL